MVKTKKQPTAKSKTPMLNKEMMRIIDALGDNWMVRLSNDGESYGGFKWGAVGVWTECQTWNPSPVCGDGLHGQNHEANGHNNVDTRFEFCETEGERVAVESNKIKVRRARILWTNQHAYLALQYACRGEFAGHLCIVCDMTLKSLKTAGSVYVMEGASLTANALAEVAGSVDVMKGASLTANALAKAGSVYVMKGASLTANALAEVAGSVDVMKGASLTANALAKAGSVDVREGASLTANALAEVAGSVDVMKGASLTANALAEVAGSVDVREGASLTAPKLKRR